MRLVGKLCASAAIAAAAALGAQPASAHVGISIEIGTPYVGYYDYSRPCWWYRQYDLPVPRRCYRYFYGIWGPDIFVDGDFIFRDRDDYWRWRDRDDYRHWRDHDFHWRAGDHDEGLHRGWYHDHGDWDGDHHDHDHGDWGDHHDHDHGDWGDHHDHGDGHGGHGHWDH